MKVIHAVLLLCSIAAFSHIRAHAGLLTNPSESSNNGTPDVITAQRIYDVAKKTHDQAVISVANIEANEKKIIESCTLLKTQQSRFKDNYDEILNKLNHISLQHPSNPTQQKLLEQEESLLNQQLRLQAVFVKQKKQAYATCETKTLAQAQKDLFDAKKFENDSQHRLEQAKEILAHARGTNTNHTTSATIPTQETHPVELSYKQPIVAQDPNTLDPYHQDTTDVTDLKWES